MLNIEVGNWNDMPFRTIREGIDQAVIGLGADLMTATIGKVYNNAAIRPHFHDNEQLAFILDGCCDYHVGDKVYKLKEGGWLVIPSNVEHYIHVYESEGPCVILEVFSPKRSTYVKEYLDYANNCK